MSEVTGPAERGREAFARQAWGEVHAVLSSADALDADDLERLATAAHLLGKDDESAAAWERAYAEWDSLGRHDEAARAAFWLGLMLLLRGESARAGGWLARAERAVGEAEGEGTARGFLLLPAALDALGAGEASKAYELTGEIVDIAQRSGNKDLLALGVLGRGQASLALGETSRGMRFLDEVMVSVTTGEVSPIPAGIAYCAVIEACMDALDLRRAAEWTDALVGWCSAQPDLVPYRGQCLVHRSQVLQAHGAWTEAAAEAERARQRLADPAHPALGLALYQQGELLRLQGEFGDAERAYRAANEQGRDPAPGFALLRAAEGNVEAALAAIQRILEESRGQLTRPTMLAAAVDVLLAAGDVAAAHAASDELTQAAVRGQASLLQAMASYAAGSVLLAEGDATAALPHLRRACTRWRALEIPYDEARARVQIAGACRSIGDHDAADLELDVARRIFERLGAKPDLARAVAMTTSARKRPDNLTERECEVLRLVATGKANRDVAAELVISEHTVSRHLQNIFAKLGLSSRAAATAYAYEHDLV